MASAVNRTRIVAVSAERVPELLEEDNSNDGMSSDKDLDCQLQNSCNESR